MQQQLQGYEWKYRDNYAVAIAIGANEVILEIPVISNSKIVRNSIQQRQQQ